jgi:hypothetical protein
VICDGGGANAVAYGSHRTAAPMIRHSIRSRRLELEKRSLVVNQKQMLRLMREANLLRQPKRFVVTAARSTLLSN